MRDHRELFEGRSARWAAWVIGFGLSIGLTSLGTAQGEEPQPMPWKAGFAKTVITPDEPMWMSGYGGRDRPAEGKVHDLYAKAAAFQDPDGKTAVFIATDLIGVSAKMTGFVSEAVEREHGERYGLQRADLLFSSSHTHCGPALDDNLSHMLAMQEDDWKQVRAYQKQLDRKLIALIGEALDDLQPARIAIGTGACGFAVNRRAPIGSGPTDHTVPVMRVTSVDGETLRGIIFGYACHNTTLGFYRWCGDYAGFACLDLEERNPGAVALFFAGCGADQNPLPRRALELAEQYGQVLSRAVGDVLNGSMMPVSGSLRTGWRQIPLEFESVPSREEVSEQLNSENRFVRARAKLQQAELEETGRIASSYPYPVQVWRVGDQLTWIALGGEVVVDYAIRFQQEYGHGGTWVTGYANDVMAYIPSERVLNEGGYEGGGAMLYYQLPSPWKSGVEAKVVDTVRQLADELRTSREPASDH